MPGALRMLELMHRRYGKLPWNTVFQPAIALADGGFSVSPYLARSLAAAARAGMTIPAWLTTGSGKAVTEGTLVRNPELAQSLRMVASDGANAMYRDLADQIVAATQHSNPPGRMSVDDVASYQAVERKPLCLSLWRHAVCSFPPPSYGGVVVLETLGILAERYMPPYSFLDPAFVHRFIEAGRLAEADRIGLVGDPDTSPVPFQELLSAPHLRARAALIDDRSAIGDAAMPHPRCTRTDHPPEPSTSQIAGVDAWGNALAMTTTININFGAWLTVDGFFLNDAMTNFSHPSAADCAANAPAGDKRPETSMAPVMATDAAGAVVLVGGSAGAGEIVDYVGQAVLELLQGRMPAEALDDGHVSAARAPYADSAGVVELERDRAIAQLAGPLAAIGHNIRSVPLQSGTAFIVRRRGHLEGASDPRRDGTYASSH